MEGFVRSAPDTEEGTKSHLKGEEKRKRRASEGKQRSVLEGEDEGKDERAANVEPEPISNRSSSWYVQESELRGIGRLHSGGSILPLVDGKEYFSNLAEGILTAENFIFFAGWDFDPRLRMLRYDDDDPFLADLLIWKADRGVDVRVLCWKDPLNFTITSKQVKAYFRGSRVLVRMQAANAKASHHQKIVCLDASDVDPNIPTTRSLVSYVGGIDLTVGRYDDAVHTLVLRNDLVQDWHTPENDKPIAQQRQPWHDVHCKTTGRVAFDIYSLFARRWNKESAAHPLATTTPPGVSYPSPAAPGSWYGQVFLSAELGTLDSQLMNYTGIHDAYLNAIQSAKRFVEFENQYFISSRHRWRESRNGKAYNLVAEALLSRIERAIVTKSTLHAFIVIPLYPETKWSDAISRRSGMELLRNQYLTFEFLYREVDAILKEAGSCAKPDSYVSVFSLGEVVSARNLRNMIYVHSKIMIVDDEYLLLGSANIFERSLGGMCDGEIWSHSKPVVRSLRKQLVTEHAGPSACAAADFASAESVSFMQNLARTNLENFLNFRPMDHHLLPWLIRWQGDERVPLTVPTATRIPGTSQFVSVCADGTVYDSSSSASTAMKDFGAKVVHRVVDLGSRPTTE